MGPDPNPNAQYEMGQWTPFVAEPKKPDPWKGQSMRPPAPKSELLGWITSKLLAGQNALESVPTISGEGSPLAGLSYISDLLGVPGMLRTADRWNYGMDTGMPTMTRPMSSDATDATLNAIPLAAGAAKLAAPVMRAGTAWRPGGTVSMFHSPTNPAEKARERVALDMELAGKSKREISIKTGMSRWPDQDGMLVEMDDSKAPYVALDAVLKKRPATKAVVENHRAAAQYAGLIADGKTPGVAQRILKTRGVTMTPTARKMAEENSVSDIQESLKTVTDGMVQPVGGFKLPDILDHPDLYAKFPDLKDIKVEFRASRDMDGNEGYYRSDLNIITLDQKFIKDPRGKEVILHEIQHPIDLAEGRAPGTSPREVKEMWPSLTDDQAMGVYRAETGEARARVTQHSTHLDEAQRRDTPASLYQIDNESGRLDVPEHILWNAERMPQSEVHSMSSSQTLGKSLENQTHTLKTLERLPMNRDEISIQTIREQMARPDVTKSEKDVLESVIKRNEEKADRLTEYDGSKISAEDLIRDVGYRTENFQLASNDSSQWADYGLQRIQRASDGGASFGEGGVKNVYASNVRTTQWNLPDGVVNDTGNHFGNPNYFAHTRAFEEDGIPHVIELQSDLAQKAGKVLTGAERAELEARLAETVQKHATISEIVEKRRDLNARLNDIGQSDEEIAAIREQIRALPKTEHPNLVAARVAEIQAKLAAGSETANIKPMLKNWDRRLVNEELAKAAREHADLPNKISMLEHEIAKTPGLGVDSTHPAIRDLQSKLEQAKSKLAAPPVVRFASADTVAKVEGWPVTNLRRDELRSIEGSEQAINSLKEGIEILKRNLDPENFSTAFIRDTKQRIAEKRGALEELEELQAARKKRLPELEDKDQYIGNQGIYDRYAKEITNYLKSLGGKPYTDPQGHTWIEVPVKSGRVPLFSMSGAPIGLGALSSQDADD